MNRVGHVTLFISVMFENRLATKTKVFGVVIVVVECCDYLMVGLLLFL